MTGVGWLRERGRDEWVVDRIDPCEAGTCGHPRCWQGEGDLIQRAIDRADAHDAMVHEYRDVS